MIQTQLFEFIVNPSKDPSRSATDMDYLQCRVSILGRRFGGLYSSVLLFYSHR